MEMKVENMGDLAQRACETIVMLQTCLDDSGSFDKNATVMPNVCWDSFTFVINEAIDVIIKLYGGIKQ